jgi:DNA-nicking Smr family endonuclease
MNKIDLHGVKHENVARELDQFFWQMMQKNIGTIEVVTGISQRMIEIVKETCDEYGFKVSEISFNPGILIVDLK